MSGTKPEAPKRDRKREREARLSEALRENLKKRKDQARARASKGDKPAPDSEN